MKAKSSREVLSEIRKATIVNKDWKDIGQRDVMFGRDFIGYATRLSDGQVILSLCEMITEEQYQSRNIGA